MINDYFLFSHIVDCLVSIAFDRVVVLVDLYSQASTSGEVIWLWKMSKAMVLHSLQDVFHAHPLASLDHVVIGAGTSNLTKLTIKLSLAHQNTNIVKGTAEVIFV